MRTVCPLAAAWPTGPASPPANSGSSTVGSAPRISPIRLVPSGSWSEMQTMSGLARWRTSSPTLASISSRFSVFRTSLTARWILSASSSACRRAVSTRSGKLAITNGTTGVAGRPARNRATASPDAPNVVLIGNCHAVLAQNTVESRSRRTIDSHRFTWSAVASAYTTSTPNTGTMMRLSPRRSRLGYPNPGWFGSRSVHAAPASRSDIVRCPTLKMLVTIGRRRKTPFPIVIANRPTTAAGTGPIMTIAGIVTHGPKVVAPPWVSEIWQNSAAVARMRNSTRRSGRVKNSPR